MIYGIETFALNADHTDGPHDIIPGFQDYAPRIYQAPGLQHIYLTDGVYGGRAMQPAGQAALAVQYRPNDPGSIIPTDAKTFRVAFWAKRYGPNYGGTEPVPSALCMMSLGSVYEDDIFGVVMNPDGTFYIARGGSRPTGHGEDSTVEKVSGNSFHSIDTNYHFYEVYLDFRIGLCEFYIDGELELTGTTSYEWQNLSRPYVYFNIMGHPPFYGFGTAFASIILTDGERLYKGQGPRALQVIAAVDGYQARVNSTFRGNLVINGASYQTIPANPFEVGEYFEPGNPRDYVWVRHFLYDKNPATGGAWNSLSEITAWGVCTYGAFPVEPDGLYGRMTSLGLNYILYDTDGFPYVATMRPNGLTYLSGHWVKVDDSAEPDTDHNYTYSAYINDVPRIRKSKELRVDNRGCILFSTSAKGGIETTGITFAEEYREDFEEFSSVYGDGIPFESYFISGYTIVGDADKEFQSNYVTVNYDTRNIGSTSVGGAFLQGVWDYSLDGNTGRWGTRQQVYRFTGNYKNQMVKLKVRGHGRSLQIKITSEQNKDYRINGWSTFVTTNGAV